MPAAQRRAGRPVVRLPGEQVVQISEGLGQATVLDQRLGQRHPAVRIVRVRLYLPAAAGQRFVPSEGFRRQAQRMARAGHESGPRHDVRKTSLPKRAPGPEGRIGQVRVEEEGESVGIGRLLAPIGRLERGAGRQHHGRIAVGEVEGGQRLGARAAAVSGLRQQQRQVGVSDRVARLQLQPSP